MTFYQYDEENVYYFVYLPINYDTTSTNDSSIEVSAILTVEMDRHRLSEAFALREPEKKEGDQFSLVMFNLKHFLASSENIRHSFKIKIPNLDLVEPYKFNLSLTKAPQTVYLSFMIENCIKDKQVCFEIVDSDILIEEPMEIVNNKFVKKETKLLEHIDYFIFNKNVRLKESFETEKWRKSEFIFKIIDKSKNRRKC